LVTSSYLAKAIAFPYCVGVMTDAPACFLKAQFNQQQAVLAVPRHKNSLEILHIPCMADLMFMYDNAGTVFLSDEQPALIKRKVN
jgi:hypothetical protein